MDLETIWLRQDYLDEMIQDLYQKFEEERNWWRHRWQEMQEYYRLEQVVFEDRLRDELTRSNDLGNKIQEIEL